MIAALTFSLYVLGTEPAYFLCREQEQQLHWLCEWLRPAPLTDPDGFAVCFTHTFECHQIVRL